MNFLGFRNKEDFFRNCYANFVSDKIFLKNEIFTTKQAKLIFEGLPE